MNLKNNNTLSVGKWPSKKQWLHFFKVLEKKEKIAFGILLTLFISSLIFLVSSFYIKNTNVVPADYGRIREGVLGQPQFINPLYAPLSDIDKDLTELIFSSLMTFDNNGNIVPDLINDYSIEDDGKTINFSIKENAKWHDGVPLTIDDVIFTIDLVQDPEYLSPLRTNWQGVEIEKISDYKALFKLKQVYSGFEESLVNLKILPKHIWKDVSVQSITSNTQLNVLSPIGSGPYMVSKTLQRNDKSIKSMILNVNKDYYGKVPHIQRIDFYFYNNEKDLLNNLKKGNLDSGNIEISNYTDKNFKKYNLYSLDTPNYFAIFLNNEKKPFDSKEIRQALSYITNKQEIADKILDGKGEIIDSFLLPSFYGLSDPTSVLSYDEAKGQNLLDKNGYTLKDGLRKKVIEKSSGFKFSQTLQIGSNNAEVKKLQECLASDSEIYPSGTISGKFGQETKTAVIKFQEKYKDDILTPNNLTEGTGKVAGATIKKLNEVCFVVPNEEIPLSFVLKTTDNPILIATANLIKEQWEKQGIKIEIQTMNENDIKKVIRERNFDILLFGEKLGGIPDPIPFWHSSQRVDPGLNLSLYQNTKADQLMEKARKYSNFEDNNRKKTLEDLQNIIIDDAPAIPLFTTNYLYLINKNVKGFLTQKIIESSKRFVDISNWYIKEKRVWK
ncbi:MAG TPA: ABC transporter substrate-binding protein [Candidatus Pacearchaeota archaeon]|nr:ABC transporter substrate-binding protein [Candidatus Pacearchaeota archaeon]HPR79662.1 ABC transporter substrate-binding protein [Candidatus Pacearchaeota archaeon]